MVARLVLCGLPSCGKSSVASAVATRLTCPWWDSDRVLEARYRQLTGERLSCREIFHRLGREGFRRLEIEAIASLSHRSRGILALGGGSLESPEVISEIREDALLYLNVPTHEIWERLKRSGLPAYLPKQNSEWAFFELAVKRQTLYSALSTHQLDLGGMKLDRVIDKVVAHVLQYIW